jgi:hypothetical protein
VSPTQKKRQNYSKRCDDLFAWLVRTSGPCVTSGVRECKGNMQCSHVLTRSYRAIRWDFRNAVPQCAGCHTFYTHRPLEWEIWNRERMGLEYDRLRAKALTYAPVDTKALLVELRELERERLAA